jgi:hypothetical protein
MKKKQIRIFLITGFGKNNSLTKEEKIVTDYFSKKGFVIETSRNIPVGYSFHNNIIQQIKSVNAVIILLNSERLNIAFEAGIAYSFSFVKEETTFSK